MKNIFLVLAGLLFVCSCKKKQDAETVVDPEPVKKGTVHFNVVTYDSLGQPESNAAGITVKLNQPSLSTLTDSTGKASFFDIPYATLAPVLLKYGYEGPPLSLELNKSEITATLPFPKRSTFKIGNFSGQFVNKDSLTISFLLDKQVPSGKTYKLAVITSTAATLSSNNYGTIDVVNLSAQNIFKYNIAKLTKFKEGVARLDSGAAFFVNAITVSYGTYQSNLFAMPVLLGDNEYLPKSLIFIKNWK